MVTLAFQLQRRHLEKRFSILSNNNSSKVRALQQFHRQTSTKGVWSFNLPQASLGLIFLTTENVAVSKGYSQQLAEF